VRDPVTLISCRARAGSYRSSRNTQPPVSCNIAPTSDPLRGAATASAGSGWRARPIMARKVSEYSRICCRCLASRGRSRRTPRGARWCPTSSHHTSEGGAVAPHAVTGLPCRKDSVPGAPAPTSISGGQGTGNAARRAVGTASSRITAAVAITQDRCGLRGVSCQSRAMCSHRSLLSARFTTNHSGR